MFNIDVMRNNYTIYNRFVGHSSITRDIKELSNCSDKLITPAYSRFLLDVLEIIFYNKSIDLSIHEPVLREYAKLTDDRNCALTDKDYTERLIMFNLQCPKTFNSMEEFLLLSYRLDNQEALFRIMDNLKYFHRLIHTRKDIIRS